MRQLICLLRETVRKGKVMDNSFTEKFHAQPSKFPKGWDFYQQWPRLLPVLLKMSPISYCALPSKVRVKDNLLHPKDSQNIVV